jgi:TP901 family phage tail tape measure protein
MSANEKDLVLRLVAETKELKAGLASGRSMVKGFASASVAAFKAAAAGMAALSAAVGVGIHKYANFSEELANVGTMLGDQAGQFLPQYSEEIRNLAVQFGETTGALSGGLYDILSASIDASKATGVLEVSVRAARAGMSDTKTAADAVTTVLNSYQMSAEEAGSVSDALFSIIKRGKTTFDELAPQIGLVASRAASSGVSLEEMGAALSTMTRTGVPTRQAVTALRATIATFSRATDDSKEAAEEFGVKMDAATLRSKGLLGVLQDLKRRGATADDIANIFPREEALTGIIPLFQQLDGFVEDVQLQTDRAGATQEAFAAATNNVRFSLDRAGEALNNVFLAIGKIFAESDVFHRIMQAIISGLHSLANIIESQQDRLNRFLNWAMAKATALWSWLTGLVNTEGASLAESAANLVASLYRIAADFTLGVLRQIGSFVAGTKGQASGLGSSVTTFLETLLPQLSEILTGFWVEVRKLVDQAIIWFINKWPEIREWLISEGFPKLLAAVKGYAGTMLSMAKNILAAAGKALLFIVLAGFDLLRAQYTRWAAELFAWADKKTGGLLTLITGAVEAGIDLVTGAVMIPIVALKSAGSFIWNHLSAALSFVWERAHQWALDFAGMITQPFKSAWEGIKEVFDPEKKGSPSLLDRLNEVRDATSRVMAGMGQDVASNIHRQVAGPVPGGELGGVSNTANINLTVQGVMDDKLLNDQIVPQLERAAALGRFSPGRR